MSNSRIITIKNVKFSGYYFYMNLNIWGDFQICISVPLSALYIESSIWRDQLHFRGNPAGIYSFKVNNENIRTMCEIYLKLKIKTLERRQWQHFLTSMMNDINDDQWRRQWRRFLLTLNRFQILFWCLHCWLWISKYRLEIKV